MTDKITLIEFLKNYIISIPKIQRHYIQGQNSPRNNAVRTEFLSDIKQKFESNSEMNMDFIYGSLNNGIFTPLDGQQRLTTLFLLHWFVLNSYDDLNDKEYLKKFSFEVRDYSKEFVQKLTAIKLVTNGTISENLENQTWFLSYWKKDTTVSSMLNMLDAFQNEFGNSNFEKLAEWLSNKVTFYNIMLNDFQLGDELYVKMNARGKSLSDYENFKSWLDENIPIDKKLKWSEKLDSEWTNLIWEYDNGDNNIDDEMMLLFRTLIIFHLKEFTKNPTDLDRDYKLLHSQNENGSGERSFISLKQYETFIGSEIDIFIEKTAEFLNCFCNNKCEIEKLCKDVNLWDQINNPFKSLLQKNTLKNKVLFYALYAYIIKHKEENFSEDNNFKRYLRIIRNLVEYTNIGFADLNIYLKSIDYLAQLNDVFLFDKNKISGFNSTQIEEESEKIKGNFLEEDIILAENSEFLKGRIYFLIHNSSDESEFLHLLGRIEKYFDKNGVRTIYQQNALFLRNFISKFTDWEQFWKICYSNRYDNWKVHFDANRKEILYKVIKDTLLSELESDLNNIESELNVEIIPDKDKLMMQNCHKELYQTDLLSHIENDCYLKQWNQVGYFLKPYNAKADHKKFFIGNRRNNFIKELIKNNIDVELTYGKIFTTTEFFCGINIHFKYDKIEYYITPLNEIFTKIDNQKSIKKF